jgi:hypothetical protein
MDDVLAFCKGTSEIISKWTKDTMPKLVWPVEEIEQEV